MIKRAIFIGGCVRSGTTLLGAMLGAPADCAGVPKSQFKAQLLKDPRLVTPESIHAVLANHWRFKLWDLPLTVGDLPLNGADAERPARVMRRITSFAGLEFTPAMTEGGGFAVPRYTVQQHARIASRPDPTRIDAWRKKLTPREQEIFEHLTEDFLGYMGDKRHCAYPTRDPSALEKVAAKTRKVIRKHFANRVRSVLLRTDTVRFFLPLSPRALEMPARSTL